MKVALLRPQDEGCSQMGATHFKEVMEELERVTSTIQTHRQPGNLIDSVIFFLFFLNAFQSIKL